MPKLFAGKLRDFNYAEIKNCAYTYRRVKGNKNQCYSVRANSSVDPLLTGGGKKDIYVKSPSAKSM